MEGQRVQAIVSIHVNLVSFLAIDEKVQHFLTYLRNYTARQDVHACGLTLPFN